MATRSMKVLKTLADTAFEPEKKTKKETNISLRLEGSFSLTIRLCPSK
jgi:hypothetical protein